MDQPILFGSEREEQLKLLKKNAPVVFENFIAIKVHNILNKLQDLRYTYTITENDQERAKIVQQGTLQKQELEFYKSL